MGARRGLRVDAYLILSVRWMGWGGGGRLFKAGRLWRGELNYCRSTPTRQSQLLVF